MDISVTEFRLHCLEWIRRVERSGEAITLYRHGKVVAQLTAPPQRNQSSQAKPWQALRGSGELSGSPDQTVLSDELFDALR